MLTHNNIYIYIYIKTYLLIILMHMTTFEWKNNKTSIKRCRFSSIGSRLPGPGDPGCNLSGGGGSRFFHSVLWIFGVFSLLVRKNEQLQNSQRLVATLKVKSKLYVACFAARHKENIHTNHVHNKLSCNTQVYENQT